MYNLIILILIILSMIDAAEVWLKLIQN